MAGWGFSQAYDLDPLGDKFKGAPIVNELVTLTENERARLTCILAGYEETRQVQTYEGPSFDGRATCRRERQSAISRDPGTRALIS